MSFLETLVQRATPWAACHALEEQIQTGQCCKLSVQVNWAGILYSCNNKMQEALCSPSRIDEAFGWAHIRIVISQALASGATEREIKHSFTGMAMDTRITMIEACGHRPGDNICDANGVLDWCLSAPEVQKFLNSDASGVRFGLLDSDVRVIYEMVSSIAQYRTVEDPILAKFLNKIETAKRM